MIDASCKTEKQKMEKTLEYMNCNSEAQMNRLKGEHKRI